jgi:hypothetical protein
MGSFPMRTYDGVMKKEIPLDMKNRSEKKGVASENKIPIHNYLLISLQQPYVHRHAACHVVSRYGYL